MEFLQMKGTQDWRKEFWTGVTKFCIKDILAGKSEKGHFEQIFE